MSVTMSACLNTRMEPPAALACRSGRFIFMTLLLALLGLLLLLCFAPNLPARVGGDAGMMRHGSCGFLPARCRVFSFFAAAEEVGL